MLVIIGLHWQWEVVNKTVKLIHEKAFPKSTFVAIIYRGIKKMRKYYVVLFSFFTLISIRFNLDYYGITDLPLR